MAEGEFGGSGSPGRSDRFELTLARGERHAKEGGAPMPPGFLAALESTAVYRSRIETSCDSSTPSSNARRLRASISIDC